MWEIVIKKELIPGNFLRLTYQKEEKKDDAKKAEEEKRQQEIYEEAVALGKELENQKVRSGIQPYATAYR